MTNMKKVLLVDDDGVTLKILSRLFKPHADNFQVVTAANGKEAVDIINRDKIDLVLTDLKMPEMDGFELLAHMIDNHPSIPVFVMTTFGDSDIEEKVIELGARKYFDKPINVENIIECIFEELDADTKSQIWGISLPAFMQMLDTEGKTCTLTVKSDDKVGKLYFLKGRINAAETGELKKEEAAYEMLAWKNAVIEIENFNKKKKAEIETPLMNILMEGLRLQDEKTFNEDLPEEVKVIIDKDSRAILSCPKCGHSYTAILKRKK
jgi:YesN/AraC family two-component response regulator